MKKKTSHKKRAKKKKKDDMWAYSAFSGIVVILMLILFFAIFLHDRRKPGIMVLDQGVKKPPLHGAIIEKSPEGGQIIMNYESKPADCTLIVRSGDTVYKEYSGIIMPGSSRDIPDAPTGSEIKADCRWNSSINVTGCENSTFFICNTVRKDLKLEQCLGNDITYQHFCVALISHNSSYCGPILDEVGRVHCYAYVDHEPELCENLSAGRDWCYQDLAMNWGRADLCAKINDNAARAACMAVVNKDVAECTELDESSKLTCIIQLADILHDKSLCELVTEKEECYRELGPG